MAEVVQCIDLYEGKLLEVAFVVAEEFEELLTNCADLRVVLGVKGHLWVGRGEEGVHISSPPPPPPSSLLLHLPPFPLTYLSDLIVGGSIALHFGHHLRFLPVPVRHDPFWGRALRHEVLGVRGESQADVLLERSLWVVQNLLLSERVQVEYGNGRPISALFRNGSVALVWADCECSGTLAAGAEGNELLRLLVGVA